MPTTLIIADFSVRLLSAQNSQMGQSESGTLGDAWVK